MFSYAVFGIYGIKSFLCQTFSHSIFGINGHFLITYLESMELKVCSAYQTFSLCWHFEGSVLMFGQYIPVQYQIAQYLISKMASAMMRIMRMMK